MRDLGGEGGTFDGYQKRIGKRRLKGYNRDRKGIGGGRGKRNEVCA